MISNDNVNNKESSDLAKRVALKFLGDDPHVHQQFLDDLIIRMRVYPAPEIIIEIAEHLREFSQLFYNIIAASLIAYLFYRLQKREAKRSQEELEAKLHEILKEHRNQITDCLQRNEELRIKFKKVNLKKIYIRVKPDMKTKWEIRLKTYSDKASLLQNPDEATKTITKILEELTDKLNQ